MIADPENMKKESFYKPSRQCSFVNACYLADDLKCYGYKTDCVLYQASNGEFYNEDRFHEAMNRLIDRTKAKYDAQIQKALRERT